MSSRRKLLIFAGMVVGILILAGLLRPVVTQHAIPDGNVVLDQAYTLTTVHEGDLVALGGSLTLTAASRVTGDAALVGETVSVAGQVDGNLVAAGQTFRLEPGARVAGDLSITVSTIIIGGQVAGSVDLSGGAVTILDSAVFGAGVSVCGQTIVDQRAAAAALPCLTPSVQPFGQGVPALALIALALVGALTLTGLSALSVTFFPRQISHIEEAVRAKPRSYGGVGLAAYGLAVGLFAAVMFLIAVLPPLGLLLVPVFLILGLLLLLLSVSGLVTLTVMLGDWLLRRAAQAPQPPLIAGVAGSLTLSAGLGVVALLPHGWAIGALLLGVVSSVGLGAALSTRAGTRPVGRTYFIQG